MKLWARILVVLLLWLPFSVACLVAVPVALFAVLANEVEYAKSVLRAMDRLTAAVLGYSGDYTVSAECSRSECRVCAVICWVFDWFEKDHCNKAARSEFTKF